jgi:hypothetical protein
MGFEDTLKPCPFFYISPRYSYPCTIKKTLVYPIRGFGKIASHSGLCPGRVWGLFSCYPEDL